LRSVMRLAFQLPIRDTASSVRRKGRWLPKGLREQLATLEACGVTDTSHV
jgi:hypothetical protein